MGGVLCEQPVMDRDSGWSLEPRKVEVWECLLIPNLAGSCCRCAASIVAKRDGPLPGMMQYKVHYDGWKQKWDEWIIRDSGRLRCVTGRQNICEWLQPERLGLSEWWWKARAVPPTTTLPHCATLPLMECC